MADYVCTYCNLPSTDYHPGWGGMTHWHDACITHRSIEHNLSNNPATNAEPYRNALAEVHEQFPGRVTKAGRAWWESKHSGQRWSDLRGGVVVDRGRRMADTPLEDLLALDGEWMRVSHRNPRGASSGISDDVNQYEDDDDSDDGSDSSSSKATRKHYSDLLKTERPEHYQIWVLARKLRQRDLLIGRSREMSKSDADNAALRPLAKENCQDFWGPREVLSGEDRPDSICEAAHIKDFSLASDGEKVDPFNMLRMHRAGHKMFDEGWFTISSANEIIVSDRMPPSELEILRLLTRDTWASRAPLDPKFIPYLQWHRENRFVGAPMAVQPKLSQPVSDSRPVKQTITIVRPIVKDKQAWEELLSKTSLKIFKDGCYQSELVLEEVA